MADMELDKLRRRKLLQMQKRFSTKKNEVKATNRKEPLALLNQVFIGRAWEVFEAAKLQYPKEMNRIEEILVQLISEGKVAEKINGEELYSFFHQLGLKVGLKTRIQFMEHGKLKSINEKMKQKE